MTPIDLTQCPPPEGMEWKDESRPDDGKGLPMRRFLLGETIDLLSLENDVWSVSAFYGDMRLEIAPVTDADLPAAYRRALLAVGLASPWTSEVPTTPGRYLVEEPKKEVTCWSLLEDGRWSHSSWATFVLGLVPLASGTLFMPCPQPPKERP